MPYNFGAAIQTLSQNGSTTTSNRSIVFDCTSTSPDALRRPHEGSNYSVADSQMEVQKVNSEPQVNHKTTLIEKLNKSESNP